MAQHDQSGEERRALRCTPAKEPTVRIRQMQAALMRSRLKEATVRSVVAVLAVRWAKFQISLAMQKSIFHSSNRAAAREKGKLAASFGENTLRKKLLVASSSSSSSLFLD
uniref:Uncharacterized protein n=1 Tax=Trichuris muris TaxID=70415 RepID=A0A5S6QZP8_TRIMR